MQEFLHFSYEKCRTRRFCFQLYETSGIPLVLVYLLGESVLSKVQPKKGLKLSMKNVGVIDVLGTETLQLPLYMSFRVGG